MKLYLFILIAALLIPSFTGIARAQDGQFTASVDASQVAMGDQVTVTFSLSGRSGGNNFRPPSFANFVIVSGPNQSTNMQIINGSISSSVSYSYVLQPKTEGKLTIGPATIEYNGKQLQTQPVTVTVAKGSARPRQGQQEGNQSADIARQFGDNLFLKAVGNKANVYQGEQITVTYKIYTRVSVVNYSLTKVPAFTGFWSEDLNVSKQVQLTNEVLNGKQYRVGILKKSALFPQRSGTLQLDPMEVECLVQVQSGRQRSNNLFDQFFNDPFFGGVQNVKHVVRSEPVKITVQPLPDGAGIAGFTGAVGRFTMESWIDKKETKTNDPITMKVKIAGKGNLKLLEAPRINVPSDFERYDPKMSDNITNDGNVISGSRTFEYLLIPRHPGQQKIPSFPFTYFDVEKKNYVTVNSPEFSVAVERGAGMAASGATGVSKEDVKLLGEDIRFIKSGDASLQRRGDGLAGSVLFYAATVTPFFAFIGFITFMRRRERALGDVRTVRNRRARKMAQQRLAESKKFLQAQKREEFYAAISRALWGYASDKLNIPAADLTMDGVESGFRARNVPPEMLEKLRKTVEECEFARFAPAGGSEQMDALYAETVNLISGIEEKMR